MYNNLELQEVRPVYILDVTGRTDTPQGVKKGKVVKYRKKMSRRSSKKYFKRASGSKALNYSRSVMRGGIRL